MVESLPSVRQKWHVQAGHTRQRFECKHLHTGLLASILLWGSRWVPPISGQDDYEPRPGFFRIEHNIHRHYLWPILQFHLPQKIYQQQPQLLPIYVDLGWHRAGRFHICVIEWTVRQFCTRASTLDSTFNYRRLSYDHWSQSSRWVHLGTRPYRIKWIGHWKFYCNHRNVRLRNHHRNVYFQIRLIK